MGFPAHTTLAAPFLYSEGNMGLRSEDWPAGSLIKAALAVQIANLVFTQHVNLGYAGHYFGHAGHYFDDFSHANSVLGVLRSFNYRNAVIIKPFKR